MRKITLLFALCSLLFVAGCGVKSDLDHPNGKNFPRNYPVY
ncbi:MAG: lipoprotein [Alphaproteobacteria bacterium]|nr:lipoprotein [Alphaproteobacteria bacterium]